MTNHTLERYFRNGIEYAHVKKFVLMAQINEYDGRVTFLIRPAGWDDEDGGTANFEVCENQIIPIEGEE